MHHSSPTPCADCGAPVHGKFCESCGTAVAVSACRSCGTEAPPGAIFCANCGTSLRGDAQREVADTPTILTPPRSRAWVVPAVIGVAAVAALAWAASRPSPTVTADVTATAGTGSAPDGTPPDLSKLSPQEQFLRLSDRIETSVQSGDTATVVRFFPMMEQAFTNLPTADRNNDLRFHLALLRAQVGHFPGAVAQVDTIVAGAKNHLLVDYLRALIADYQGNVAAGRAARLAFRQHFDAEIAQKRPEYLAHRTLLDEFLKTTPTK